MPKHGKRFRMAREELKKPLYDLEEAVKVLKRLPQPKFDQSVELHLKLGIDPRQSDQQLRGSFTMPQGLGKSRRVVAFCPEEQAEEAKEAGAVEAGGEELIEKIQGGWTDFDVAVAHPQMMRDVAKLGRILGPQGLMPSPKAGTVGAEIPQLVADFAAGKLEYRNDSGGNLHAIVGKMSFEEDALCQNIRAFVEHVRKSRPNVARGQFFQKAVLTAAMSPGIRLDVKSLPIGV